MRALAAADDQIPGVPLPATTSLTGTLSLPSGPSDPTFDQDDVFKVRLQAGEIFSARVDTDSEIIDCDLYLFGIGATNIATDQPVAVADLEYQTPDMLWDAADGDSFVAPATGDYYLDVLLVDAPAPDTTCNYRLEYGSGFSPNAVTIQPSASAVTYGNSVTISGFVRTLAGFGISNQPVELWETGYPFKNFFARVVATGATNGDGSYSFARPVTRSSYYRVVSPSNQDVAWGVSGDVGVKAKVALGAPKFSSTTKYRNRAFTVYGYLKPKHTAGQKHVKITASRLDDGVWRVATNYNYSSTHTKYSTSIILPYAGKWKLVASTPDDGYHAATTSSATYVTVK